MEQLQTIAYASMMDEQLIDGAEERERKTTQ